ncbi:MAG: sugar transferase [Pararhodobacter sp.]|nr:sugar transferase [Pararhodobacter sp.]
MSPDSLAPRRRQALDGLSAKPVIGELTLGVPHGLASSGSEHVLPAPAFLAPRPNQNAPARAAYSLYSIYFKRGIDITLALVLLLAAAPVLVLLALALWLESGNPFYSQPRLGRNGQMFRMFKLRTMVMGADQLLAGCLERDPDLKAEWDRNQKLRNDPRITAVGRLLRKTSMDELPQLYNVLAGHMSIIGPRPMLADQLPLYRHPEAYLSLRPGLSGLWQVSARNDEDFDTRAHLDKRYFERVSFWLDLRIFFATFRAVFRATGH